MPKKTTGNQNSHPIAELYKCWVLDFLIELVQVISHDIAARPHNYKDIPDKIADILNDFRFRLGSDPKWPDAHQRTLNFKPIYQVALASPSLRQVALACHEGHIQIDSSLTVAFDEEAYAFREQISSLEGRSLSILCEQTAAILGRAVDVLRCPEIAQVFGFGSLPDVNWPLEGSFNGNGANMIDEMIRTLRRVHHETGAYRWISENKPRKKALVPLISLSMSPHKFITLQKAAYYGSLTISGAMNADSATKENSSLTRYAYNWTKALQKLLPDAVRAWKDIAYRSTLTNLEWGMAPNPAGDVWVESMSVAGGQTSTMNGEICCSKPGSTNTQSGEICCSSGNLDCVPETWGWSCTASWDCGVAVASKKVSD